MEKLNQLLKKIDIPVVVEGKSDVAVLEKMGVKRIVPLNGRPLFKVVKEVAEKSKEVLVLTDYDSEGRKLAHKLNVLFTSSGVQPWREMRRKIGKAITEEGRYAIEEIDPEE
ncbi:MAG: toprim domain-containing protein [Candidatus Aenigmatarchaeota archaeon]